MPLIPPLLPQKNIGNGFIGVAKIGQAGIGTAVIGNPTITGGGTVITGSVKAVGIRTMNTTTALDSTNFTTTITGANSQIKHLMLNTYAATNLQFVYANRLSEVTANNSITVAAALEYPLGTFTRITFSSNPSVTLAAGAADVFSDPVPVTIPAGATYYEHTYVTFALAKGCPYLHVRQLLAANGDGFSSSNGEVDKSLTSLPAGANAWYYGAVAIVGNTNAPFAIGIVGDSIVSAGGDTQTGMFVAFAERAVGGTYGTVNVGQSSESGTTFSGSHANRMSLLRKTGLTHALMEYGTNDIAAGTSAATLSVQTNFLNSLLAASNINPFNTTIIPRTNSTDNWATFANQTPQTNFAVGGNADNYNTTITGATPTFASVLFDGRTVLQDPAHPFFWLTNGTGFFYTLDGTHPNSTSAPVYASVINLAQIGNAGVPLPTLFTNGNFYLNANTITGLTDGQNVVNWTDSIGGLVCTPGITPPVFKLKPVPEGLLNSVRSASANTNQNIQVPTNTNINTLPGGSFYMLFSMRVNTNAATAFVFHFGTSGHRLILNTGYTLQMDFFYNSGNYSFQTIPLAGAAGAGDWVTCEFTFNSSNLTNLGFRTAAGRGGPNTGNKAATVNAPSGGVKMDTGQMFIGSTNAGVNVLDGDILAFYITKTLPTQAQADQAFYYLRGLIGA